MISVRRLVSILVGTTLALSVSLANAADVKLPDTVVWTAYDLSSVGYGQAVAMGKSFQDAYGTTLRVIPASTDVSRIVPVRDGRAHFATTGSDVFYAVEGAFGYASPELGPQPLRLVSSATSLNCLAMGVPKDSGIKTPYDLKGKRMPWVRGSPSLQTNVSAFMAFGNVYWDDVEKVEMAGYGAAWEALINGQVDGMTSFTTGGIVTKAEAGPHGLYWLPTPLDDEAGWARLNEVAPHFNKYMATLGVANVSKENPLPCAKFPYPIMVTYPEQDEDLVYNMTKAISEQVPNFIKSDPTADGWADDRQTFEWVLPYHPGAIKFWKEKGLWTDAAQKRTDAMLARQKILADAWAEVKGKSADEVKAQWMKVRAAALKKAGLPVVWNE